MDRLRGAMGAATALLSVATVAKLMGGDYVGAMSCIAAICILVALLIKRQK